MTKIAAAALLAALTTAPALAASVKVCASGAGAGTSLPFHMDGPWVVSWTLASKPGIFQATVMPADGSDEMAALTGVVANQVEDASPGQAYEPKGGDFYIKVNSFGGHWTVCATPYAPGAQS